MFFNPGDNVATIVVENGVCPLCGGNVDTQAGVCDNCGKLEYNIITIGSTADAEMMETLRKAARGDADAQMEVGWNYESWDQFPFNQKLAHYWYKKAAEGGNANAQQNLAVQYLTGRGGVEQNYEKAFYWTQKAAMQGWDKAQANLGYFYLEGVCVEEDNETAVYWLTKAAEQGHKQAQFNLAQCYINGWGVDEDEEEAIYWLRKSAAQGFPNAMELLEQIG